MKAQEEDNREKVTQLIDVSKFGIKAKEEAVKVESDRWGNDFKN